MPTLPTFRLALAALTLPAMLASCGGGSSSSSSSSTTTAPILSNSSPKGTTTSTNDPTVTLTAAQQMMLDEVNRVRKTPRFCNFVTTSANSHEEHLPARTYSPNTDLVWNSGLVNSAQTYSNFLTDHAKQELSDSKNPNPQISLEHGLDGLDYTARDAKYGYVAKSSSENIADNFSDTKDDIQKVVEAWLNSDDGHCQAIMNETYTDFGAGYSSFVVTTKVSSSNSQGAIFNGDSNQTYSYWVQEFGSR